MVRCRTVCAAVFASSFAACSLLVDTSGLVGSRPSEAGAPDVVEAGVEADAPAAPDAPAATDAPPPSRDAAPSGCADPQSFCDDFDQPPLGARWTSIEVTSTGGAVTLVDGGSTASSRFALQASTPGVGSGTDAYLSKRLAGVPTRVRCEFDYQGATPANNGGEIDVLSFATHVNGGKDYQLYVAFFDKWVIGEYAEAVVDRVAPVAGGLPSTKWTHLVLETDGAQLTLTVDGVEGATLGGLTHVQGASFDLELGVTYAKASYDYSALYDALACTFAP